MLKQKLLSFGRRGNMLLWLFGSVFRVCGAKEIAANRDGMSILVLNKETPLGKRGTVIYCPRDKNIYVSLVARGYWEKCVSDFLGDLIRNSEKVKRNEKIAILDIGAHVGLTSIQALKKSEKEVDLVVVEPLKLHFDALIANLSTIDVAAMNNFKAFNCALGASDGTVDLHSEVVNLGNSSIFRELVTTSSVLTRVEIRRSDIFVSEVTDSYREIVFKLDTQGSDAQIFSMFPEAVLHKALGGLIEIWAHPNLDADLIRNACDKISKFSRLCWSNDFKNQISIKDVEKFWTSKSSQQRNLYLMK